MKETQTVGLNKSEKISLWAQWCVFALFQIFCTVSLVIMISRGWLSQTLITLVSMGCLCVPWLLKLIFKVRIPLWAYIFIEVYALCPMLGHAHAFYYWISWWDTWMHFCGGVAFAMLGGFLLHLFNGKSGKCNLFVTVCFAIFFSVTVSVAWEFIEYAADSWFHTDMQKDVFVDGLYSYFLTDGSYVGSMENIQSVQINGVEMKGYFDIGLIDTMTDMIFETIGALLYGALVLVVGSKALAIQPRILQKETTPQTEPSEEQAKNI